ncbi:MAG: response regulator transcription factor [Clostridiales bacterium]
MKIYCVEDEKNIRDLIVYAVSHSDMECQGFGDAKQLYAALAEEKPNLILLDIMLPGEDGTAILQKLRKHSNTADIPIIMVTAKGNEYDKIQGLDLGADDYVTKPFSVMELISRIKAVLRRTNIAQDKDLCLGNIRLNTDTHRVFVRDEEIILTNREFELLCYLIENRGIVLGRDTLLQRVWGYDYQGETRTVDVHIRTLRQKLGADGDAIETVRSVGYRMGG